MQIQIYVIWADISLNLLLLERQRAYVWRNVCMNACVCIFMDIMQSASYHRGQTVTFNCVWCNQWHSTNQLSSVAAATADTVQLNMWHIEHEAALSIVLKICYIAAAPSYETRREIVIAAALCYLPYIYVYTFM